MAKRKQRSAYHPFYWPIWVLYPLLRLISLLPSQWLFAMGEKLGVLLAKIAKRSAHITEVNLKLCFPELTTTEHQALLNKHYAAMGRGIFETLLAWFGPRKTLKKLVKIKNGNLVTEALTKGKGLICIAAHFSCSELVGAAYAQQQSLGAVYQTVKNPALDKIVKKGRKNYISHLIASHHIRAILNALANNQILWFAPDQNTQKKRRVLTPFFGHTAVSSTMLTRLVELSGAAVLFLSCARQADGHYVGTLIPAPPAYPSPEHDVEQDAHTYNQFLEKEIRTYPEQYLWAYKFFSKGQNDAPSPYKSNKAF